jgi:estrone sulfotransferase
MSIAQTAIMPRKRRLAKTFNHSAFIPTIRQTDVFICTYPKSGTTWLGFLLAQSLKTNLDERLNLKNFNEYVPDVNLLYTKAGSLAEHAGKPDPRFFLVHARYDANFPKVVYVVRDPRDVMVSFWHYQKFLHKDFSQTLEEYVASDAHWPCEWDEHVESWMMPRRHPHLMLVRYEDMHADNAGVLRRVLAFAGLSVDEARIAQAVKDSRFEKMREAEEKFGVHGAAGDATERFVRKGACGSWRQEMSAEAQAILERKYEAPMREMGYAPERV